MQICRAIINSIRNAAPNHHNRWSAQELLYRSLDLWPGRYTTRNSYSAVNILRYTLNKFKINFKS